MANLDQGYIEVVQLVRYKFLVFREQGCSAASPVPLLHRLSVPPHPTPYTPHPTPHTPHPTPHT
ncbi:MAG: hypothetical protein F6K52_17600 [Moorea sp. SIO3H5]|nr:hypothetical protein [Moorena sp. SIO3H5]